MRLRSLQLASCLALLACSAPPPPAAPAPAPAPAAAPATPAAPAAGPRFTPPDASGFGRVGELAYLEEIIGDAQPSDLLPMVVWLHGRGDKPARGWLPISTPVPVRVIMPRAPLDFGAGYSWFKVRALEATGARAAELAAALSERADQIEAAIGVLAAERPTRGLPIAGGFSQGGMLSYTLAVRHPHAFRALLPMAGLLPDALWPKTAPPGPLPPVYAVHGTVDPLVPIDSARAAIAHLAKIGYQAELREYAGVPHSLSRPMLEQIDTWLDRALAE